MNAQRLRGIVNLLLEVESAGNLQNAFGQIGNALNNLSNNPTQPNHQIDVRNQIKNAESVIESQVEGRVSLLQRGMLHEIRADRYFSNSILGELHSSLAQNGMTPAVVRDEFNRFVAERKLYLDSLRQIQEGMDRLGINAVDVKEGEAELVILIPRSLFKNHLGGLARELNQTNRIARVFSEVIDGSVEEVEVKQISTTDPTFYLGMTITVSLAIGKTVKQFLECWKNVEEIRRFRAEGRKLGFSESDLPAVDHRIADTVKQAVEEQKGEADRGVSRVVR